MKVQKLSESFNIRKIDSIGLTEELLLEEPSIDKSRMDRAKAKQDREKQKAEKKAQKALEKDFSNVTKRAKFYIDNNYSKPYSQAEWRALIDKTEKKFKDQQEEIDKMPSPQEANDDSDPKNQAQKKLDTAKHKFDAQIYNAIVVAEEGHYIRRGGEYLERQLIPFSPGHNDKITTGYFMEPYKYKGSSGGGSKTKSSGTKSSGTRTRSGKMTETSFKKFQRLGKLTGMQLFDAESKPVELDAATLEALPTYTIQVGSVKMDAASWLSDARKAGII